MREGLQLKLPRHAPTQLRDLRKRHLAGENHAPGTKARVLLGSSGAHDRGLRGDVHRHLRRMPARKCDGTEVRHDHGIRARLGKKREERRQRVGIRVGHDCVHGHVDRNTPLVRIGNRLGKLPVREVAASRAHAPPTPGQVDRVRAKVDGLPQLLRTTGRRQKFHGNRGSHGYLPCARSLSSIAVQPAITSL